ncbi:MAG: carotenoid biosynthesis protein [Candidatus Lokiarchaeota archaeon]|nr:carotenoid biosynthesis protein [Candidatus Lokiarchaeota archaeon]
MERLLSAYKNPEERMKNLILTIFSIVFFFVSWLVANVPIGEQSTWVSALFIVAIALPSYYFLYRWTTPVRAVVIILLFSIFPIIIESIGISTGFPYGPFEYTEQMGYKILGLVPWSVAFAFAPLVLGSITIANKITNRAILAIPLSALLLVIVDLILDPAAVVLNIWVWGIPGPYYGIPLTNYSGWFFTALIASVMMHILIADDIFKTQDIDADVASSLLVSMAFWTGFSFWTGLWIPVIIGISMFLLVGYFVILEE